MLREWLTQLNPDRFRHGFYGLQIVVGTAFVVIVLWIRSRRTPSGFKEPSDELPKKKKPAPTAGKATSSVRSSGPAQLTGIRIDGAPHEVLGVAIDAPPEQVQQAYRELMKRYHPDKLGRPGTPQWKEGQRIAEALNHARDRLIKK